VRFDMTIDKEMPGEPERDPWLSEALRHAPDAGARPSAELSREILRQARAATVNARPSEERSKANAFVAAWAWLARPSAATGFAGLMAATLVGVMWWDRPLDETLVRPPMKSSSQSAAPSEATSEALAKAKPAAPPVDQPTPSTDAARPQVRMPTPIPIPIPTPTQTQAQAREREQTQEQAQTPMTQAQGSLRPSATPGAAALSPSTADRRAREKARIEREASPEPFKDRATSGDAAPTRRSSRGPEKAAPDVEKPKAAQVASGPMPFPQGSSSRVAAAAPTPALALAAAPAPAPASAKIASDGSTPVTDLLAAIAREPLRWQWQRGGERQPLSAPLLAWMSRLDRATIDAWRADSNSSATAEGNALRLFRDGELRAIVRIDEAGASIASPSGPALRARLSKADLTALKQLLDEAAP
jgi:hypothetical protein